MTLHHQHPLKSPQSLPQAPREDQRLCVYTDYVDGLTTARSALEAIKILDLYLRPGEEDPGWNEFLSRLQDRARAEAAEEYARRRGQ